MNGLAKCWRPLLVSFCVMYTANDYDRDQSNNPHFRWYLYARSLGMGWIESYEAAKKHASPLPKFKS